MKSNKLLPDIMKQFYLIALLTLMCSCHMDAQEKFIWNKQNKMQNLKNREDPTKWSLTNFKADMNSLNQTHHRNGVFPVPDYDLVAKNSFIGLGSGGEFEGVEINGKTFLYNFFYIKKNKVNQSYIDPELNNDIFFTIIISTDFIDKEGYTHNSAGASSRNHPNYVAQGLFKTKNTDIKYSAFITADRDSYALVSDRLFDLSLGRVIFIVPQKDKSLRSKQLSIPPIPLKDMNNYIESIIKEQKNFYLDKGAI